MDEILASIRRIIADDQEATMSAAKKPAPSAAPAPVPAEDDILDLAELDAVQIDPVQNEAAPMKPADTRSAGQDVLQGMDGSTELTFHDEPHELEEPQALEPEPDVIGPAAMEDITPEKPADPPVAAKAAPTPVEPTPRTEVAPVAPSSESEFAPPDRLMSRGATDSINRSFGLLSHTVLTQNARTLEDLVADMLKPMLREWLDDNLPPLVERMVRTEIERVLRGSR